MVSPADLEAEESLSPYELLNALKGKYPKTKVTLKDIEAVIELLNRADGTRE